MECPQLMIAPVDPKVRLSARDADDLREQVGRVLDRGEDLIFTFAVNIWQLVDGRWEALPTNTTQEVPDGTQVIRTGS